MKVSLNWIKQYLDFELPAIDELAQRIGEQLGAVEEIIDLSAQYQGIVIARVVSVANHPDADRLHVCRIDDGGAAKDVERDEQGYVQVVCGAPNVHEGMLVAWLPPGVTVPESIISGDPFVLEVRKLRGVVSNGMLASMRELALGDEHDGILEIDEDAALGTDFAEFYDLNDTIIDIENKMFTHRPDCFGQLGVAREIAGILGQQFHSPDWYATVPQFGGGSGLKLTVENQLSASTPRFMAVALANVQIGPSPVRIQTFLARVGAKAINNVVDATNYMMLLTGQPVHAYDYDKVASLTNADGAALVVRYPAEGEQITLLGGKTITPRPEAIMIATDRELIGIGGVMGGNATEVDANTKNVILEIASFDMYSIRRTSMAHGLFTDAVTRNNKGQSPLQCEYVMSRLLTLLQDVSGAQQASEMFDFKHPSIGSDRTIRSSAEFVNVRLGSALESQQIMQLLGNVEIAAQQDKDDLLVTAPFWRTDLEIAEDIVEEIGRLYGYDRIDPVLPQRSIAPSEHNTVLEQKRWIRQQLARSGANEVLTYSFVHGDVLKRSGQNPETAFRLTNALSPDVQYYRLSVTPSLLQHVHANVRSGHGNFALYEIGKLHEVGFVDADDLPAEQEVVAAVFIADDKHATRYAGAAYYQARAFAERLLVNQEVTYVRVDEFIAQAGEAKVPAQLAPFAPARSAVVMSGNTMIGIVGEYKPAVQRAFKLPAYSAGFELELGQIGQKHMSSYRPLSKFPAVTQDITLRTPANISYGALHELVQQTLMQQWSDDFHTSIELRDIYQAEGDQARNITFRVRGVSSVRTLQESDMTRLLDAVANEATKLEASRV